MTAMRSPGRVRLQRRVTAMRCSPHSLRAVALALMALPAAAGVESDRWRLVGRNVGSSWVVNNINFYSDSQCTTAIQARPFRSLQGNGLRYDGSAISGPKHVRTSAAPADAFEANAVAWETGVPCPSTGDSCFIGFQWLTDQVDTAGGFATVGILQRGSEAPQCVALDQSSEANRFASSVMVQYWSSSARAWQDHTEMSGLTGGAAQLRIPEVPLAR
ncbi:unnamed protein product [Durusdinium trenchii]|uniref:Uncharacterized protein n=2 Tax=Durusdinium trenchii TaxID=1381693 RepID=A0ABP0KE30_9DINO